MELNDAARDLIGQGADATLVTLNPDGSPQVTVVWVALQSTPDGDELVTAHLAEHKKVRNVRQDSRVAVTIISPDGPGLPMRPYLAINGTRAHRRRRGARTPEDPGPGVVRSDGVPAGQCPAGIPDPHPHRQGRRRGSLGALTCAIMRCS